MRAFVLLCLVVAAVAIRIKPETTTKPVIVPKGTVSAMRAAALTPAAKCTVTSASAVVANMLKGVTPTPVNCGGMPCLPYLAPPSCLGLFGPLGSLGPLGALGPVGSNSWNPSAWMGAVGDWSSWSKQISGSTSAPLSAAGPMGAYNTMAANPNDFVKQLQAMGVFTPLGPIGPLGAVGLLGPLGPMGIHGFARDKATGAYTQNGAVQRTVTYPWDASSQRTWELFEYYPSLAAANAVQNQDSSFMVESTIAVGIGFVQNPDVINFNSKVAQYITIVSVPQNTLDAFYITVTTAAGAVIATSKETFYVNWVQFLAAPGGQYKVSVVLGASTRVSPFGFTHRTLVTGSSALVASSPITGAHIKQCKN